MYLLSKYRSKLKTSLNKLSTQTFYTDKFLRVGCDGYIFSVLEFFFNSEKLQITKHFLLTTENRTNKGLKHVLMLSFAVTSTLNPIIY